MFARIFALFSFLILPSINAFSVDNKTSFPDSYFEDREDVVRNSKNMKEFENGKVGDKFIDFNEYKNNYKDLERGNTTNIIKCPCKCKKKPCSCKNDSCHVKPENMPAGIVATDPKSQYRFVPVPMETDEQVNPYFMMLTRQRLMAQTATCPNNDCGKEIKQNNPEQKNNQMNPFKQQNVRNSKFKFYRSLIFGMTSGSASFTSMETPGKAVGNDPNNVIPTGLPTNIMHSEIGANDDGSYTNYTLQKDYSRGKSQAFSLTAGVEYDFSYLFSVMRIEIMASGYLLNGSISNLKNNYRYQTILFSDNYANFAVQDTYGNSRLYVVSLNTHLDFMKKVLPIYPSIGIGLGGGYMNFDGSTNLEGKMVGPLLNTFLHGNIDIDDGSTLFGGIKLTRLLIDPTFKNSYTDRDVNSANTNIKDFRVLYDRTAKMENLRIIAIEGGLRFY